MFQLFLNGLLAVRQLLLQQRVFVSRLLAYTKLVFELVQHALHALVTLALCVPNLFAQLLVLLRQLLDFVVLLLHDTFVLLDQSLGATLCRCVRIGCEDGNYFVTAKCVYGILLTSQSRM